MVNLKWATLISFLAVGSIASAAQFYVVDDINDKLQLFDSTALTFTDIGSLGVAGSNFGDLSWGTDGQLYWLSGRSDNSLYRVNTTTGAATFVGNHGVTDLFGLGLNLSNGVMYGTQFSGGTGIFTVNQTTGAATQIGNSNDGLGGLTYINGFGLVGIHDGGGELYVVNTDGTTTLITSSAGGTNDSDITYDSATGLLWAADWSGNVYSYDVANSFSRTQVLSGQTSFDGIVVANPVPEPGSIAALGLGGLALLLRRRRKN
jgi:hypothetical protein